MEIEFRAPHIMPTSHWHGQVEVNVPFDGDVEYIIQHVENNRFSLLEKLTQDVLDIAREHHWVTYAEVEIDKLHALRYADSVSMTLSWQR